MQTGTIVNSKPNIQPQSDMIAFFPKGDIMSNAIDSVPHTLSNVNSKSAVIARIKSNFPTELQQLDQWVVWKLEQREDKLTKVPYQINGDKAKSDNAATWATFEAACNAFLNGIYSGVGFMFSEHDPYVGVDFDKCIVDGVMNSQRNDWMHSLDSYAEISQSGTGVHIIVRGVLPEGRRKSNEHNAEMYDHKRFFVVTGDHIEDTPRIVNSRKKQLVALHTAIFPAKTEAKKDKSI
jgi:primase-polymerase (primpol)-like protein